LSWFIVKWEFGRQEIRSGAAIGAEEFVFGRHENNQRPIKEEIERRAGISFGPLANVDPLKDQPESVVEPLTELRNRIASLKLQLDALDRSHDESAELASKAESRPSRAARVFLSTLYFPRSPLDSPSANRGDRTSIELFSGSFGNWTKSLIAIAQALAP
jgi:hypothetical protein